LYIKHVVQIVVQNINRSIKRYVLLYKFLHLKREAYYRGGGGALKRD
jgi:hypothetical protein